MNLPRLSQILIVLSLPCLVFSLIFRLAVLLQPHYNEKLPIEDPLFMILPSDICCVVIWTTMGILTWNLAVEIEQIKARMIKDILQLNVIIMVCILVSYEVGMFYFIYNVYAFVFNVLLQLTLFIPYVTLLSHSLHQIYFFAYCKPVRPINNERLSFHIVVSVLFNLVMIFHLFCMAMTCHYTIGITVPAVLFGVTELLYRIWVICKYIDLYRNPNSSFLPPDDGQNPPASETEDHSGPSSLGNDGPYTRPPMLCTSPNSPSKLVTLPPPVYSLDPKDYLSYLTKVPVVIAIVGAFTTLLIKEVKLEEYLSNHTVLAIAITSICVLSVPALVLARKIPYINYRAIIRY